jgi:hypothetical protein
VKSCQMPGAHRPHYYDTASGSHGQQRPGPRTTPPSLCGHQWFNQCHNQVRQHPVCCPVGTCLSNYSSTAY